MRDRPLLSVIVVVHNMTRQALNTLYSISLEYQYDVGTHDYEVIVVENESADNLDARLLQGLKGDFRYFRRKEEGVSPARAINYGLERAGGEMIGLIVDGARMLTPRVISCSLMAGKISSSALVVVPGYHLGNQPHHTQQQTENNEKVEMALLEKTGWKSNGYRLFEISCWSGANTYGIFHPFIESNCLFASRESCMAIGGADTRFQRPGGGMINLDIYRRLSELPESRLFVLPGEGSFHQFHRGVTTSNLEDREEILRKQKEEYLHIRNGSFEPPKREPILLGSVTSHSMRFLERSVGNATKRFRRFRHQGLDPWSDDRHSFELPHAEERHGNNVGEE